MKQWMAAYSKSAELKIGELAPNHSGSGTMKKIIETIVQALVDQPVCVSNGSIMI